MTIVNGLPDGRGPLQAAHAFRAAQVWLPFQQDAEATGRGPPEWRGSLVADFAFADAPIFDCHFQHLFLHEWVGWDHELSPLR